MSKAPASGALAAADAGGVAAIPAAPVGPRWVGYLLVAFGLAILVLFAATTDVRQVAHALRGIRPALLGLAVVVLALQILVRGIRWRYMIYRLTGTAVSVRFAAISIVAGIAAGSVVPARTFEMAKAMLLKGSYGTSLGASTSAMIVERALDLLLIVVSLTVAALLLPGRIAIAGRLLPVIIIAIVAGCALVAAAPLRVRGWTAAVLHAIPAPAAVRTYAIRLVDTLFESILLWRQGRTLGVLLPLTGLSTALDLVRVCAVFWGVGVALPVPVLIFTYLGAMMLGMALLIPGGVGVTEVSQVGLIMLLAPQVAPSALIRSAVLADRFLSYYLVLVIGAAFLIAYHRYRHVFR